MNFTATQIAEILEGDIVGNPDVEVSKLAKIEEGTEGTLTFLANPKYTHFIYDTKASVTIVNKDFETVMSPGIAMIIKSVNPADGNTLKLVDAFSFSLPKAALRELHAC